MADVLLVCVRENVPEAEALAEMMSAAGLSISDRWSEQAMAEAFAVVLVWSRGALRSRAFLAAAEHAINADKAVIACLDGSVVREIEDEPVIDLRAWEGDEDAPELEPLLHRIDALIIAAHAGTDVALIPDATPALFEATPSSALTYRGVQDASAVRLDAGWSPLMSAPPAAFGEAPPPVTRRSQRRPRRFVTPLAVALALIAGAAFGAGLIFTPAQAPPQGGGVAFAQAAAAAPEGIAIGPGGVDDGARAEAWVPRGREPASAPAMVRARSAAPPQTLDAPPPAAPPRAARIRGFTPVALSAEPLAASALAPPPARISFTDHKRRAKPDAI